MRVGFCVNVNKPQGGSLLKKIFFVSVVTTIALWPQNNLLTEASPDIPRKKFRVTLAEVEKSFVEKNLSLLAARFQIDAKKALVMQAGLYANPSVFLETNIYNPRTKQFLDATENGSQVIQIQQLFLLGGKIEKRVKVAEIDKALSENDFFNVLRALKYELRKTFFSLYFERESILYYDQTIEALMKTVKGAEVALSRRAITKAEYLRLKALSYFLRNERANILVDLRLKEVNLRVLMNRPDLADVEIVPEVNETELEATAIGSLTADQLLKEAEEHRPDIKAAMLQLKYETANLDLQEANAIPDLAFGPVFNRANTYIPNYWGITAQVSIPLFDRNQGNIEAAKKAIITRKQQLLNERMKLEGELSASLIKAKEKDKIYQEFKKGHVQDFRDLMNVMVLSYQKRYISVIEFADFFETYRNSIVQLIDLKTQRTTALENINYAIGKDILFLQTPTAATEEK
ncbi:MAG TPA: TolC family protein [Turneriella sp.]|nr:TolC family protein [Turneriella sp.]